jgi:MFS family permease
MVYSDLLALAAQAAVAGLFISGAPPIMALVALAAVNGAANAMFIPASRGLLPQIVDPSQLQSANALTRLSQNCASLVGAAISGVIIVAVGAGWAIGIDAATFGISALLVLTSRAPAAGRGAGHTALLAELREGWREFTARRWAWVVVSQFALVNLCFSPCVYVLGPVVAKQYWGGELAWSAVITANAIGLIVGSLLVTRLRPARPLLVATLATFGFLPPFFLLAAHAPVWLAAISMLVNGICADVFEVLWTTALQQHIPDDKLSRVTSYDALGSFVLGPLGLLAVGPAVAAAGIGTTLAAAGSLVTAGNVLALCAGSVRRLGANPEASPASGASPSPAPAPYPSGQPDPPPGQPRKPGSHPVAGA